jgi:hypothetical protein
MQFQKYNAREHERKLERIKKCFDYLVDEEIIQALEDHNGNEDELMCSLTEPGYLKSVRKKIACQHMKTQLQSKLNADTVMTKEQQKAYLDLLEKRKNSAASKTTTTDVKMYTRFLN